MPAHHQEPADRSDMIVIGAGPAGLIASAVAARCGATVLLLEQKAGVGTKLLLTGKGRCNLTNDCLLDEFLPRFSGNGQFLRDAFKRFFNRDLMRFFEERGVRLVVERQLRVFPQSGRSSSIVEALRAEALRQKVRLRLKARVERLFRRGDGGFVVVLSCGERFEAAAVILATGGASYRATGSDGSGYDLARSFGHSIVALRPGLVPLEVRHPSLKELEGITLRNIRLTFKGAGRSVESEIGELLFTASGISGPLVLTQSGRIADWLVDGKSVVVSLDLKPALSEQQLDARLLREFAVCPRQAVGTVLRNLAPRRLAAFLCAAAGVEGKKQCSQVSAEERRRLCALFKRCDLAVFRCRPLEEAMVTRGGVSLKEVDPRTMQSRFVKGLYFAGEILDVDADTGGFNLQAAFSTGYLAAESAVAGLKR